MDPNAKKTALRMIPYGLYVLAADSGSEVAATTVNWVTQASFEPPLVVVGVKKDSSAHPIIKAAGHFALSVLGKAQGPEAYAFFKPTTRDGNRINGHEFRKGSTGAPILDSAPASLECRLVNSVEIGDHSVFVGEVVDANLKNEISGRADDATLTLKDLGEKVFYGG